MKREVESASGGRENSENRLVWAMKKKKTLFFKISSAFIIVLAAALCFLSVNMISIARERIKTNIKQNLGNLNAALYYNVSDFFNAVNSGLSFTTELESMPVGDITQKYGILMQQILKKDFFAGAVLLDADGKELCRAEELAWQDKFPANLINETGKTKLPRLGEIFYKDDGAHMYLSYPLLKGGEIIQYLGIMLSLDELWNKFGSIARGKEAKLLLLGKNGGIVYPREKYGTVFPVEVLSGDNADVVEYGEDILAYKKIDIFIWEKNKIWWLILRETKKEAFRSIRKMTLTAVAALFIALAMGISASMLLARHFLMPVKNLMKGVEELASGNLRGKLEIRTNDEIGALTAAFNGMIEKLRRFQQKLMDQERLAAVGQMSSIVGHEIRNPLWAIGNAVYYLKTKYSADTRASELFGVMEKELKATNKIVDDLLNFSRQRPPVLKATDINALLDASLSVIDIPVTIEVIKNYGFRGTIKIDSDEVRQIFVNLIKNAVQAMTAASPEDSEAVSTGGGKINLSTAPAGNFIKIEISDTGGGISPENLKKIFDPFFSTKSKGTGLGLAAVKRIMERHKGTIEAASAGAGKGAVFTIKFPMNEAKSPS